MANAANTLGPGYEVTLVRSFKAPAALLFDCFTDPERLAKWWGPMGCRNVVRTLDVRPGGQIDLTMAGPGYESPMGGEFVEIDRPRRLVFLSKAFEAPGGGWGLVNRNTLTFEETGGGTTLTLHARVETAEGAMVLGALSGMKVGWGQSLERLGDLTGGGGKLDLARGDKTIVLTRAFDAPPERVWRALTDPAAVARWWLAGGVVVEEMDVRPGGKWSLRQDLPGGVSHRFWGEYMAVEPTMRLVMTQGFDEHQPIEVVTVLTSEWGRTVLTRTMTFPNDAYRDGMLNSGLERGAAETYDALAEVLAQG